MTQNGEIMGDCYAVCISGKFSIVRTEDMTPAEINLKVREYLHSLYHPVFTLHSISYDIFDGSFTGEKEVVYRIGHTGSR